MRFLVFFLGFLASLIAGYFGWFWLDYTHNREMRRSLENTADISVIMPEYGGDTWVDTAYAAIWLFVAAGVGTLGSLFTLVGRGRHGAVLMLLATVGPAVFNPLTLIFTGPLIFAALLSVFVYRPVRVEPTA